MTGLIRRGSRKRHGRRRCQGPRTQGSRRQAPRDVDPSHGPSTHWCLLDGCVSLRGSDSPHVLTHSGSRQENSKNYGGILADEMGLGKVRRVSSIPECLPDACGRRRFKRSASWPRICPRMLRRRRILSSLPSRSYSSGRTRLKHCSREGRVGSRLQSAIFALLQQCSLTLQLFRYTPKLPFSRARLVFSSSEAHQKVA